MKMFIEYLICNSKLYYKVIHLNLKRFRFKIHHVH